MAISFLFFLFDFIFLIDAANWAQVSGIFEQNTVIPYLPSPGTPHWAARYGMTAVVVPISDYFSVGSVFLLGGDTFDGSLSANNYQPGLLDNKWENGYKNDVWSMSGTEWLVKGDSRLRTRYHNKIPQVQSKLAWKQATSGLHPPPGTTYDSWISCASYFNNKKIKPTTTCTYAIQWSPRRHHASIYFNGYMWVIGGRAREFMDLPEERSVGGVLGPRIKDVTMTFQNNKQLSTTQREASVYKSDVWRSLDGKNWDLVNPGCKVQQSSLLAKGNAREGKYGLESEQCNVDDDCFGNERCEAKDLTRPTSKTCVCKMFSPREQHAVVSHGSYTYLVGGFTSILYSDFSNCGAYACGDTDASAYRYYLSDVWRSGDGETWELVTENAFSTGNVTHGRGGHQMLVIDNQLWVFGGRGGDNKYPSATIQDFNEIWVASLVNNRPTDWKKFVEKTVPWEPRTGHQVVLETSSPSNGNLRTLYVIGGYTKKNFDRTNKDFFDDEKNAIYFDDVWSWRIDDKKSFFKKDGTSEEIFSIGNAKNFRFDNHTPVVNYVTPLDDVSKLKNFWTPDDFNDKTKNKNARNHGLKLEIRPYITDAQLNMLHSEKIFSIRDLARIDLKKILKLRGFDVPQVAQKNRLNFFDICDYRALAIAVDNKCSLHPPNHFDGQKNLPRNIVPVFGSTPPKNDLPLWYGIKNYAAFQPPSTDPKYLLKNWDGCTYEPLIEGLHGPNVNGIGYVTQVEKIKNVEPLLLNLFCKQTPGPRAFHSSVFFEERLYLFGGMSKHNNFIDDANDLKDNKLKNVFYADTWYRDYHLPTATMKKKPKTKTPDSIFQFTSDKAGVFFEYKLWDPFNYKELRPWTATVKKLDISWLDWRKGGPGNGVYRVYVRAVDAANNRDERYKMGTNVYEWNYVSPTPYDIILGCVFAFLFLCFLAYLEYRRRVKKAAMERYAMKRMRRKFKAMQRDINGRAVDWRTLYLESKEKEEKDGVVLKKNKKNKKNKKKRDKLQAKRDVEKKKKDKEKDLIKKKLKASKDIKNKIKSAKIVPVDSDANMLDVDFEKKFDSKKTSKSNAKSTKTTKKSKKKVHNVDEEEEKIFNDFENEKLDLEFVDENNNNSKKSTQKNKNSMKQSKVIVKNRSKIRSKNTGEVQDLSDDDDDENNVVNNFAFEKNFDNKNYKEEEKIKNDIKIKPTSTMATIATKVMNDNNSADVEQNNINNTNAENKGSKDERKKQQKNITFKDVADVVVLDVEINNIENNNIENNNIENNIESNEKIKTNEEQTGAKQRKKNVVLAKIEEERKKVVFVDTEQNNDNNNNEKNDKNNSDNNKSNKKNAEDKKKL